MRAEAKRQGRSEADLYRAAGLANTGANYFGAKADRATPLIAIEAVAFELGFAVSELFRLAEAQVEPLELERFVERARNIKGLSEKDRAELLRAIQPEEEPDSNNRARRARGGSAS